MSYIEGVGDEVTLLFIVLFVLLLVYVVWLSTSVSENPLIRVVILDRARFQQFLQRFALFRNNQRIVGTQIQNNNAEDVPTNVSEDSSQNVQSNRTIRTENSGGAIGKTSSVVSEQPSTSERQAPDTSISQSSADLPTDTRTEQQHVDSLTAEAPIIPQSVLDSFIRSTQSSNISQSETSTTIPPDPPMESTDINGTTTTTATTIAHESQSSDTGLGPNTEVLPSSGQNEDQTPAEQNSSDTNQTTAEPSPLSDDALLDGHIRIRLKYLDDRQRLVQVRPEDTIGHLKSTHFAMELADNQGVRFIFRGQELREDRSTIQAYNIEDNSVIHCLLTRITRPEQPTNHHSANSLDMSFLMLPLFALILGLMWYCRFAYRSYFSAMSTMSLVGITFLFVVAVLATWRREELHEHQE